MPVKLNRGVIELEQSFTVCKKGETLTPDQAQMLVSVVCALSLALSPTLLSCVCVEIDEH